MQREDRLIPQHRVTVAAFSVEEPAHLSRQWALEGNMAAIELQWTEMKLRLQIQRTLQGHGVKEVISTEEAVT